MTTKRCKMHPTYDGSYPLKPWDKNEGCRRCQNVREHYAYEQRKAREAEPRK